MCVHIDFHAHYNAKCVILNVTDSFEKITSEHGKFEGRGAEFHYGGKKRDPYLYRSKN
jgi:hypothetical protein